MKRFDTFGEYLFDLLPSPLKRGQRAVNQFFIFFRVMGREFDDLKKMIFRVRGESNIATASPSMLPVHGQDREMPRITGETDEDYRFRLMMKAVVAGKSGTSEGIILAVTAMGYRNVRIVPYFLTDPERWAESVLWAEFAKNTTLQKRLLILSEVNKVKPASAKLILNSFEVSETENKVSGNMPRLIIRTQISSYLSNPVHFDGSSTFDGSKQFYQETAMQSGIRCVAFTFSTHNPMDVTASLTADRLWNFNGSYTFSGVRKFNGTITTEEL